MRPVRRVTRPPPGRRPRASGRAARAAAGRRRARRPRRARRRRSLVRRAQEDVPSTVTSKPRAARRAASSSARSSTSTTRPSGPRRRSASVPACTTSPPSTITTASQIRSTSSRWCDETTMCMPNSVPMRRMRSSISVRCIGSSPSVGSSRRTSSGSCAIADASLTRCRWPVDIVPTGRKRSSPRPTSQSASLARWTAARRGQQVHLGEVPHEIGGGELRGQVVVLGRVADARAHLDAGRRGILAEHGQLALRPATGARAGPR